MRKVISIVLVASLVMLMGNVIFAQGASVKISASYLHKTGIQLENDVNQYNTAVWIQLGGVALIFLSLPLMISSAAMGLLTLTGGTIMGIIGMISEQTALSSIKSIAQILVSVPFGVNKLKEGSIPLASSLSVIYGGCGGARY